MVTPFAPMFQHLVADKNPALPTAACTNTTHMTRTMITADRAIPFGKDANRLYVYDAEPLGTEQENAQLQSPTTQIALSIVNGNTTSSCLETTK